MHVAMFTLYFCSYVQRAPKASMLPKCLSFFWEYFLHQCLFLWCVHPLKYHVRNQRLSTTSFEIHRTVGQTLDPTWREFFLSHRISLGFWKKGTFLQSNAKSFSSFTFYIFIQNFSFCIIKISIDLFLYILPASNQRVWLHCGGPAKMSILCFTRGQNAQCGWKGGRSWARSDVGLDRSESPKTIYVSGSTRKRKEQSILLRWWTSDISENAELQPGSHAVFTEEGSSASQWTAANVVDVIERQKDCAGQAPDAVSAYTQVKMKDATKLLKSPKSECPEILDTSPTTQVAKILAKHWTRASCRKDNWRKFRWDMDGKVPNEECLFVHNCSYRFTWMTSGKQNLSSMWKKLMKLMDLGEPTSFIDHVHLGCTQRECKPNDNILTNREKCLNHDSVVEQLRSTCVGKTPHKSSRMVVRYGRSCEKVSRKFAKWLIRKTEQLHKVSTPCWDDHHFKKEKRTVKKLWSQIVLKCL